MKGFGVVALILSIPLILAGIVYLFSDPSPLPSFIQDDPAISGYVTLGLGAFLLILGVILMLSRSRQTPVVVQPVAAPPAQHQVEIKRSEMNWGAPKGKSASDELQARMDAVNQKLSRIKVQYGMGELSAESYRNLTQQYEQEKAAIEKQIMDQQHA